MNTTLNSNINITKNTINMGKAHTHGMARLISLIMLITNRIEKRYKNIINYYN